jgi:hypothetical protein
MTSVDDFSDCGHDIADVVNYRRALAQRFDRHDGARHRVCATRRGAHVLVHLYAFATLVSARKHLHHVDPVGHRAGSFPTDRQIVGDSAAVSNKRVCARARCKRYRQVTA